ncbi:MAG: ribonuclease HII [Bacillota bacterium]
MNTKDFDNSFLNENIKLLAGIDEAGRGPLAGPVVAASVIFSPEVYIHGVDDSKKLSASLRDELYEKITQEAVDWSVSIISHEEIDRINILQATLQAMKSSLESMQIKPDLAIIDGNKTFPTDIPVSAVVKGDEKSFAVASASIIAKVTRDRLMHRLSEEFPEYLWHKNKGYATKEHIAALIEHGPCLYHRRTFIRNFVELHDESELK